jgi:hypothetical protein
VPGGEDADRLLTAADLVAEGLPRRVTHDDRSVGALVQNQQPVAEAVAGKLGGNGEPVLPALPRHQLANPGFDLGLQVFNRSSHRRPLSFA